MNLPQVLPREQAFSERFVLFSRVTALVVALGGASVLVGWWLHIATLKSVLPNLVSMKPNTALCLVLLGCTLWLLNGRDLSTPRHRWVRGLASLVVLITGLTLLQYLLSSNWGIDQWLFLDDTRATQTSHPGRMAPITAIALVALALAMLCMTTRPAITRTLAAGVLLIGALGIDGYFFGVQVLYSVAAFTSLAIHTAAFLVLLSLGVLFARPSQSATALILRESIGGISARALTLTIPVALGGLSVVIWLGLQWQWFDAHFGLAVTVVFGMALSVFIGQRVARELAAADAAKALVQAGLVELNQRLEQMVAERTASLERLNADLHTEMVERKTTEQTLRSTLDLLDYSQAAAKVGGWQLDLASGALYWTAETYRIHETNSAEFNPTVDAGVGYFLPESRQRITLALQAAIERGEGYALELETLTTQGTLIDVFTTCTVTMVEGKAVTLTGIFQDITAIKQAAKAKNASDQQLKLLEKAVAKLNDIVLITEAEPFDEPGPRIVFVNDAFVRRTGYSREEVMGKTPRFLQGPKTQRAELDRIGAALRKWEPVQAELINYTKSGEEFWLELDIVPVADETGWFTHWVSVERDITERKRTQMALSESESRLAGVIDSAMDAIVSVNSAHQIVLFNSAAEAMFGRTAADMLGHPLDRLIPAHYRAGHSQHISDYGSTVSTSRTMGALGQLSAVRGNGEEFPIEASISQVTTNGQKLFTVIVRDITQRKAAEQALLATNTELARSNADLEQFAHVASHDLQEPLRSISSSVQLLQRRYAGALDARADEFITHAVGGVQRMQMVIDDLLAYARISAAPPVMRVIDLNAALQVARTNLSEAIAASQALISHDELPQLTANPIQMAQLFQNLLGNALKFRGGKAATVHVGARRDGAEWVISVADQGIGIEPQYFERIFKLFQRLHTRTEYAGTGIGLTICQKIAERHGGRIWVESVLGQGTCFYFTLPVVATV